MTRGDGASGAAHVQQCIDLAAARLAASLESVRLAHLSRLDRHATREVS